MTAAIALGGGASAKMLRSPTGRRVIQGAGAEPPNTCLYLLRAAFL
jgi:hypothetical protein